MPSNNSSTAIVWFRQDLRLKDNPALAEACANYQRVIPLYIHDDETPAEWKLGAASRWWLHHSLTSLSAAIAEKGGQLVLQQGEAATILPALAKELGADAIFWNRCYEPYAIKRDKALKQTLQQNGHQVESFNGSLLFEPWDIQNKSGSYFKVFTPFWKTCLARGNVPAPLPQPEKILSGSALPSDELASWQLLPTQPDWSGGMQKKWQVGEAGAAARFNHFMDNHLHHYKEQRNVPAAGATSELSPHYHWGEISPRALWHAVQHQIDGNEDAEYRKNAAHFLSELGWREFSNHLLYNFPDLPEKAFNDRFNAFPWDDNHEALKRWQHGQTGYPIIDAAMRELWQTGIMHNRTRMIVASFLTKDLLIPWQAGQAWFWDTLVDADLANNAASWQWVAGCGADAAPYFRIFNPILQSRKFDGDGEYIRRYVPELAKLDNTNIHAPWEAPPLILSAAGIRLGETYPNPMVNHAQAKDRAMAAYAEIKKDAA